MKNLFVLSLLVLACSFAAAQNQEWASFNERADGVEVRPVGGAPPYHYIMGPTAGGTIPACFSLWSNFLITDDGHVKGTPITPGLCAFNVHACDSSVPAICGQDVQKTILVPTPVTIITDAMPNGFVGQPYDSPLTAAGGAGPPYHFTGQ
jgi:hypothetical protein